MQRPHCPTGVDFMVPVMGYVCRICQKFYHGNSGAKLSHCKSSGHLENLQVSWASSPTPPCPGPTPSKLGAMATGLLPPVFDLSSQTPPQQGGPAHKGRGGAPSTFVLGKRGAEGQARGARALAQGG